MGVSMVSWVISYGMSFSQQHYTNIPTSRNGHQWEDTPGEGRRTPQQEDTPGEGRRTPQQEDTPGEGRRTPQQEDTPGEGRTPQQEGRGMGDMCG